MPPTGAAARPSVPVIEGRPLAHGSCRRRCPRSTSSSASTASTRRHRRREAARIDALRTATTCTRLHAELEGGALAPAFEALLAGWRAQGHRLVSLRELHALLDTGALPAIAPAWGSVPGRSGELVVANADGR